MTLWPPSPFRISFLGATLLLLTTAAAPADKALDTKVQLALAKKYPGERVAASCEGGFLGKPRDAAVALHSPTQKHFRVLWIAKDGAVQELQLIPAFGAASDLDLQCLDRGQAKQLKETLQRSEAIHDFLHVPAGRGALCYFIEQTQTKCWSVDADGRFIDAGGWQT